MLPRIGLTYQPKEPVTLLHQLEPQLQPNPRGAVYSGWKAVSSEYGQQSEGGVRTSELQGGLLTTLSLYRIQANNLLVTNPVNRLAAIEIRKTISKGVEFETSGRILPG